MSAIDQAYRTATIIDHGGVPRSALACHVCKRRKSKCDRTLPSCATCVKSGQPCEYPTSAQKPGPKTGMCHRSKKRKPSESVAPSNKSSSTFDMTTYDSDMTNYTVPSTSDQYGPYRQSLASSRSIQPEYQGFGDVSGNQVGLPSPVPTIGTTRSSVSCESKSKSLLQIIHPSHEPAKEPSKPWNQNKFSPVEDTVAAMKRIVDGVCKILHISEDIYYYLLNTYFDNMTAFSLFHRPRFATKLREISSPIQVQALLAAMFSFSAHFRDGGSAGPLVDLPTPEYFHSMAIRLIDEAMEACSEDAPPLCLLQAMTLTTFKQLITGVRGRAWRSLGNCIRIAYELQLHLIDLKKSENPEITSEQEVEKWVFEEEHRRTWWVLWEFDVFASTIRRLPTAIDWHQNETWLPVDDEYWFGNVFSPSCRLAIDPHQRWKLLEKAGNKGSKAWFILINSLMRNAQSASTSQGVSSPGSSRSRTPSTMATGEDTTPTPSPAKEIEAEMSVISNAFCCATMALPEHLTYRGEFLSFRPHLHNITKSTRQIDAAKFSIHIMKQLTRFMIHHHQVFQSPWRDSNATTNQGLGSSRGAIKATQGAWARYLDAADGILTIIRNSSPDHAQFMNPFLANTIWLAAAAQVACRIVGPPVTNPQAIQSNLDLLRLTFNCFFSFWKLSSSLQERLITLEARLESFQSSEAPKTTEKTQLTHDASGSHRLSTSSRHQDTDMDQILEAPRHEKIDDFSQTSMSSYFQPDTMISPSALPPLSYAVDPSYSMPAGSSSLELADFSLDGNPFAGWDEWGGLEELLTYGYDEL